MKHPRIILSALTLSAGAFASLVMHEGYREKAYIPVEGDRPTVGFGSTFHADGRPVKPGDRLDPVQAINTARKHIEKDEAGIKQCVRVPLSQAEYDAYASLVYNIGTQSFCRSTLVRKLNAGDYAGACNEILRWDFFQGKKLRGLTIRRQKEHAQCMEANQ